MYDSMSISICSQWRSKSFVVLDIPVTAQNKRLCGGEYDKYIHSKVLLTRDHSAPPRPLRSRTEKS